MTATYDPITLADYATELISLHDDESRFLATSAAGPDLLGYDADDLVGRRLADLVHPEDVRVLETAFDGVPGEPRGGDVSTTCRLRHADGYWTWVLLVVRPAPGAFDGSSIVSMRSAEELVAARRSCEWAEETLRQVFEHAPTPMAMLGLDGRFERVNPAFCSLLETTPDQLVGRTAAGVTDGGDANADRVAVAELASGRVDQLTGTQTLRRAGGGSVTVTTRRSVAHSGTGRQHVVLHVLAVREPEAVVLPQQSRSGSSSIPAAGPAVAPYGATPHSAAPNTAPSTAASNSAAGSALSPRRERDLAPRVAADGVTGLTSRPLLLDRLGVALARPERSTQFLVMFFVDVDGVGKVLDRHGRRSLEGVLSATGNRLRAAVRGDDTVARFGDGGFVVLCPAVVASSDVVSLRQRLAHAVADGAMVVDGRKFKVTARVGAAIVGPGEACSAEDLLDRADSAMTARV